MRPVIVHIVLHTFEIRYGNPPCVAQEIRDDEYAVLVENLISFWCGRAIGAFSDNANPFTDALYRLSVNLSLQGSRDEHIDVFGDPFITTFDGVSRLNGFIFINRSVDIGDGL